MSKQYRGSCLCGGVKFSVESFSRQVANCHCTMCRKFHGAAYGTLVEVGSLRWHTGQTLLKEYVSPNGAVRTFCKECGSSLGFREKGAAPSNIEIAISVFDDEIPVAVDAQIFTRYKASWCELQQGLDNFTEARL